MLFIFCCYALFQLVTTAPATRWVNPGLIDGLIDRSTLRIDLESPLKWEELNPDALNILFDNKAMYGTCTLDLWGYTENGVSAISKLENPFKRVGSATVTVNAKKGRIDILTLGFKCITVSTENNPCSLYHMGFLEMNCKTSKKPIYSPLIPLGWLVSKYYNDIKWDTWAQSHCVNWFSNEDPIVRKAVTSVHCHPNFDYVEVGTLDYGYMEMKLRKWSKYSTFTSGSEQNMDVRPEQVCYLSTVDPMVMDEKIHASPVAQCCYARPNMTFLFKEVEASDEYMLHGSGSFRSHPAGVETFGASLYLPGQVPVLSHWYWDLLPYRYCCVWWSGGGCSDYYHKARPSPKLLPAIMSYKMAYVVGNVIIKPFDGYGKSDAFMCNDVGVYWLFKNDKFSVQVRTDLVSKSHPDIQKPKDPKRSRSSSSFITGLAFSVSLLPDLIIKLVVSDSYYKYDVYAVDAKRGKSELIEGSSNLRFFGYSTMSDEHFDNDGTLSITTFALKVKGEQLGLSVMLPRFGQEFMSILITAPKNSTKSGGLLGDVVSGDPLSVEDLAENQTVVKNGKKVVKSVLRPSTVVSAQTTNSDRELKYASYCTTNAVPHADSFFEVGLEEKKTDGAKTKKPRRVSTQLVLTGKFLKDSRDVACMSTGYEAYCEAIHFSHKTLLGWAKRVREHDPNTGKFDYCTKLPKFRGIRIHRISEGNYGLKWNQVLHLTCASPFKANKEEVATCSSGGRTLTYEVHAKGFMCRLTDGMEKQDLRGLGDFKARNGTEVFQQHIESNSEVMKKRRAKFREMYGGRAQPVHVVHGGQLLLTSLIVLYVTLSSVSKAV